MITKKAQTEWASLIGKFLNTNINLLDQPLIKTKHGILIPIKGLRKKTKWSKSYKDKKIMFWLNDSAVLIHYWEKEYVNDPLYFWRLYQNSKKVFENDLIPTPQLLSVDDKTMTLIIEKAKSDLSIYLSSKKETEINSIIKKVFDLFYYIWKETKEKNMGFPRYVSFFLEPEYPFLKTKRIGDYLPFRLTKLYKTVQQELSEYLTQTKERGFESCFGLADIKMDNLVEDKDGNILFIDVEKPEKVHWMTLIGQLYQSVISKTPDSIFAKVLKKNIKKIMEKETELDLVKRQFDIGRMNRLLLPCTIRNISYCAETNQPIDLKLLENSLYRVRSFF